MAIYYGEYEDCFRSEPLAKDITRKTSDYEVTGDAAHDGYTVYNHRLRTSLPGDWPEDEADAKRMEDRPSFSFGALFTPFGGY